ncbi:uncharacterized protein VTP21DRAFT_697 [Calcarisporiella thermophila]|uniref:uncharacterized protein n=1 Tax=Calcarisporiella thermophila TaxID=911321 RepID=UPI003744849C
MSNDPPKPLSIPPRRASIAAFGFSGSPSTSPSSTASPTYSFSPSPFGHSPGNSPPLLRRASLTAYPSPPAKGLPVQDAATTATLNTSASIPRHRRRTSPAKPPPEYLSPPGTEPPPRRPASPMGKAILTGQFLD